MADDTSAPQPERAPIIERLRTAADGYLDCTFEEGCRCIYCDAVGEIQSLRSIVRRLLDGWVAGDNCDPGTPESEEWAWERCRIAAPGTWVDDREPFEPGADEMLRSFEPDDDESDH